MKLVLVAVVALLIGYGYANLSTPKPVVVATETQAIGGLWLVTPTPARVPLRVVTPTPTGEQAERLPIQLARDCMNAPSQCSLQNGAPDWTTPAYGCDWNYATTIVGCVPDQPGDFDCPELNDMGLYDIRVIGDDWMLLDENGDGVGCEYYVDEAELEESRRDYDHRNDEHPDYDLYEPDPEDEFPLRGGPLD